MTKQSRASVATKENIREIIRDQARRNGNGYIVDLFEFDLSDEEMLTLLLAVYAGPILGSYSPAIGFYGEHVRLCNNFRSYHREFVGAKKRMSFDDAKRLLLNYMDDMRSLIRKYAQ